MNCFINLGDNTYYVLMFFGSITVHPVCRYNITVHPACWYNITVYLVLINSKVKRGVSETNISQFLAFKRAGMKFSASWRRPGILVSCRLSQGRPFLAQKNALAPF